MESGRDTAAGRYRLLERIVPDGESWLAEDLREPGERVVAKVLPETADVIAARHAAESAALLNSKALNVPVDDGETEEGRPFLVYRWVDGTSLRLLLNETGPLPFGRAANLIVQLGAAVAALHERSMVHGAIAPDHIVVQRQGSAERLILLNVGAFRVSGQTSVSPAYLAPEQLAGNPGPASDLWSIATVAAEILTGRRAFRYGSPSDLEHMQKRGLPRGSFRKLRAKLPVRAEDELRRALSYDPMGRPADVEAFTARLAEALGGIRGVSRRRLATGGLILAALAALATRNCRRR
ncbi:MAG TPA: protein kinase [Bryobacteraceae bacterium]|nr:protein kinase [Bryobacteraceae bacterium]